VNPENGEIEGVKINWDYSAFTEEAEFRPNATPDPAPAKKKAKPKRPPGAKRVLKSTPLAPDAPTPHTNTLIQKNGALPTARALEAWAARVCGAAILDVAHEMGVLIEEARMLIAEAHADIAEDLKENVELNRQLDLARIDGLLVTYYPKAKSDDTDAAKLVIRCVQHRRH
jgi:hypothetical protein